jgi:hypothetical protein
LLMKNNEIESLFRIMKQTEEVDLQLTIKSRDDDEDIIELVDLDLMKTLYKSLNIEDMETFISGYCTAIKKSK